MIPQKNTVFFFKFLVLILFNIFGAVYIKAENSNEAEYKKDFPFAELSVTKIELGEIEYGTHSTGSFLIRNTGTKPMFIGIIRSSCGLMIPAWPVKAIEAGKEVSINFRYDASRIGPFDRLITIHTNALQKTLKIKVSGKVITQQVQGFQ